MSVDTIISNWLDGVQTDLVKNYKRLGLRASGNWEKELEPVQEVHERSLKVGILGAQYTGGLENGRSPNKNQSEKAIKAWVGWAGSTFLKQWVKDKKININPFAVAYKIAREGWKVPNKHNAGGLVSDVVTRKRIEELMRQLSFSVIQDLKSDIIKDLK